jgi:cell wall-associated NlpC family hydrolase
VAINRWPRCRDRARISGLLAVLASALIVVPATAASADPSPADIERQLDEAWNTLEPIIEQYNGVHAQLQSNQTRAAELQKQLDPLQAQVNAGMDQVGEIAAAAYKTGVVSIAGALLSSGSPTTMADQMSVLNYLSRHQQEQIRSVTADRDRYAADKRVLDDLITAQARQDADLATKKKTIEDQLANLQAVRDRASRSEPARSGTPATQVVPRGGGPTSEFRPTACPAENSTGPGAVAAAKACSLIGKPYMWAAAGPNGYDCSGLALTAWAAAGVSLRHYTKWQWSDTKAISRAQLRPGDLVFFYSDLHHMGLYVGAGWMVHAPKAGDHVRMAKIDGGYMPIAGYRRPG